jgi:hypothetical protein
MAARRAPQALRSSLSQLVKSPAITGARFAPLLAAGRVAVPALQRAAVGGQLQQTRGLKTIDFAGTKEDVYGMILLQAEIKIITMADDGTRRTCRLAQREVARWSPPFPPAKNAMRRKKKKYRNS